MSHTYTNLLTHVISSTKDRAPVITATLHDDLLAYLGGIVRELGGALRAANARPDHVHLGHPQSGPVKEQMLRQLRHLARQVAGAHGQAVPVVLNVNIQRQADLVQIAKAGGGPPGFAGASEATTRK